MIPLPDPPLGWPPPSPEPGWEEPCCGGASHPGSQDLELLLRPWRLDDASALVAAWADPEIQRWTAVPARRDLAAAERWIAGDEVRRAREQSLDLVIDVAGTVVGEVGLAGFDRAAGRAEIGWWTAAPHRRRGVATAAATLLTGWARAELGLVVVARCHPDNPAAIAVARRAGAMVLS